MKIETKKVKEVVLFQGSAGHLSGLSVNSGKMSLTSERLYFIVTESNKKKYAIDILVKDIIAATKFSLLGLITNGLRVKTKKKDFIFFVEERNNWIKFITNIVKDERSLKN